MSGPFIFIATNRLKPGKLADERKRVPGLGVPNTWMLPPRRFHALSCRAGEAIVGCASVQECLLVGTGGRPPLCALGSGIADFALQGQPSLRL